MEETKQIITIIGFRDVKINDVNIFLSNFRKQNKAATIQFFNAQLIAGSQHLFFAALNGINTFEKKINISKNLAVETLLFASTQRQIEKAVEMLGLKQETTEIAVLIISENEQQKIENLELINKVINGRQDNKVLEITDKKIIMIKKLFEISDTELETKTESKGLEEALTNLIIERMALLSIRS